MTQLENQHFEDLFKQTMKQIEEVNGQFMTGKLMEKIKEKGSLYGMKASEKQQDQEEKPGQSFTQKRNAAEPTIARPDKLLKGKLVFDLYDEFEDQIKKVREEEEEEAEKKQALALERKKKLQG